MFMVNKDRFRRPTINKIMTHPLLKEMLPNVLDLDTFMEEFSHTLLHRKYIL